MSELDFPDDLGARPGRRVLINDGLIPYIAGAMAALEAADSWVSESDYRAAYAAISELYIAMSQLELAEENTVLAGPTDGAPAPATFRPLVADDIPFIPTGKLTSGILPVALGGTGADLSHTGGPYSVIQQKTEGESFYVAPLVPAAIPSLPASIITSGVLPVARGGAGVATRPRFSVAKNAAQTGLTNADFVKVTWQVENFDTNNNFASNRFTPTIAGCYLLILGIVVAPPITVGDTLIASITRNSVRHKEARLVAPSNAHHSVVVSALVDANGTTDFFEAFFFHTGATAVDLFAGTESTYFFGIWIGP